MNPILFDIGEASFTSNGLGRISPTKCTVTEERNGQFELAATISVDDRHFQDVEEGRILYAPHDDTKTCQPFEIYKISRPINGKITINARHITYRTADVVVSPFVAKSCSDALNGLITNAACQCPFTMWTDKETQGTFTIDKPEPLRPRLGGMEGSILDVYGGGEYEFDHFTIKLHSQRGIDSGVTLKYGKDITKLTKTTDATNLWNGIYPFWFGTADEGEDILVELPEKVLFTNYRRSMGHDIVKAVDMSQDFKEKPTIAQVRNAARKYIEDNARSGVSYNIDLSFVDLQELQGLNLCDTLNVEYPKYGVNDNVKIIKTVYNVLKERYDSLSIGDAKSNLSTSIRASAATQTRNLATNMDLKRASARTQKIVTGALGGYYVVVSDEYGKTVAEYHLNDAPDLETARNVWRWNKDGLGFSSTGYNGTYKMLLSGDGTLTSNF